MEFQSILEDFKSSTNGTDAFKKLKIQCENALKESSNDLESSALLIIFLFSKNYVLIYEDQAVTSDLAKRAKEQLTDYMDEINISLKTKNEEIILKSINSISTKYILSSKIF